jgi:AcrR family transcriptional regulator
MTGARTRREEYSESTREALLESATELFWEGGYRTTSLDAVAERARVTKGAIYHHFPSKEALYEAVIDRLEEPSVERMKQAAAQAPTAWDGAIAALDVFLTDVLQPQIRQLCFVEGPSALGFERWWACGEKYHIDMIRKLLQRLSDEGDLAAEDLDTLSQFLFASVTAGVLNLVRADDPVAESKKLRDLIIRMVAGLLSLPGSPQTR